jgi:hypothetical protein
MAASEITVQTITSAGATITFEDANVDGNFFENNGRTFIRVTNTNAATRNVIIDSPGICDQGFYHDVTITIAATTGNQDIGPFSTARFNDTSGNINITYSAVTNLKIAAIKFG